MDRVGFPYREETHLPGFHILANAARRASASVPYFKDGSFVVQDSTEILHHVDTAAPPSSRLYPAEPPLERECDELEELFDTRLGPAARQLWFYYVLRDGDFCSRVMRWRGPRWERALIPWILPIVRGKIARKYDVNAAGAARARLEAEWVFNEVGDRLSDGRRYLLGELFSAADITFAALAVPVVCPSEFGAWMPAREETRPI